MIGFVPENRQEVFALVGGGIGPGLGGLFGAHFRHIGPVVPFIEQFGAVVDSIGHKIEPQFARLPHDLPHPDDASEGSGGGE